MNFLPVSSVIDDMKLQRIILITQLSLFLYSAATAGEPPLTTNACDLPQGSSRSSHQDKNTCVTWPSSSNWAISEKGETTKSNQLRPLAREPAQLIYKYRGNSFSNKFHRPWCPFSQAMNIDHVILFHFRCEAVAQGFAPCQYCLPHAWKSVQCRLLKPNSATSVGEFPKHPAPELPSTPRL